MVASFEKVGVNGRFIFFFFFEKSENIEFYFRSNVFFFLSLFCDTCATIPNGFFIHDEKDDGP